MRMLAIGLIAAASFAVAAPAIAEDFYVGGRDGGVGVEFGRNRDRDRDHYRTYGSDRDYDRGYARCRTTIIREDGMVRKIRRCRD